MREASETATVLAMQQDHSIADGRLRITSGTPWEGRVGYSRAMRVGDLVFVTGTLAANDDGSIAHPDDAGPQTAFIFEKIRHALEACGATVADVVRTRMFITHLEDQAAVGAAHAAVFGSVRPCATMVQCGGLVSPEARVEIEVDAVVTQPKPVL
ncbi:MAG: RidA family protein [Phycisphaerales bacterium]